jgi:inner membrane transporter RhtA
MRSVLWPVLALLGSLVSLSLGTSFAKSLFPVLGPAGTTLLRIGFAMLMLMALWRPWRRRWTWAELPPLALYGVTLGVMNLLFYFSIGRLPFGLAIAIEFTGPLAVALWSSRRASDGLWVALAVAGLALILPWQGLNAPGALDPVGIAQALGAGACWALYIVFGQRVAQRFGAMATPMGMMFGTLAVLPMGLAAGGAALIDPQVLLFGLAVALLSSAVPYTLEMFALRHLPRQTFSILLSLEPAVGAMAGWLVLAERLTLGQWTAMLLLMLASMGSAWSARTPPAADPP